VVDIGREERDAAKADGWIGVDFDGTLAEYHGWSAWNQFGLPIPLMVARVKRWIAEGREVKIVTARVGLPLFMGHKPTHSSVPRHVCRATGESFSDRAMAGAIAVYCRKHVGRALTVQCYKDVDMIELWDDRAVQVVPNTGRTLAEEHEAVVSALRGRVYGGGSTGGDDT
jgi:hypothetical protein